MAAPKALPEAFAKEFYEVGNRPGHYQGRLAALRRGRRLRPDHQEAGSLPALMEPRRFQPEARTMGGVTKRWSV
jgi:hypothetical protein